ncbi:MAG: DUF1499 domain-containing protein [Planctomycetes bacterium]|nr:DUF1499 domain-containing protein [Planctomycetota bacterium]
MTRKIIVRSAIVLAILIGLFVITLAARSAMTKRPTNLGLVDGRLRPCPDSPNCVCTQDADEEHGIEPLRFEGTPAEAMEKLKSVVNRMPRTNLVAAGDNYLHVEFTSLFFRFVDDVEFAVEPESKRIHFRSASRTGYSDLGVNRRRMETIRAAFHQP